VRIQSSKTAQSCRREMAVKVESKNSNRNRGFIDDVNAQAIKQ